MKIKMNTTAAGPGFSASAGSIAEAPDNLAQSLIDGGYAVAVEPEAVKPKPEPVAQVEAAVMPEYEKATPRTGGTKPAPPKRGRK